MLFSEMLGILNDNPLKFEGHIEIDEVYLDAEENTIEIPPKKYKSGFLAWWRDPSRLLGCFDTNQII